MNKYETLIFDLDDTLIDDNESIKYAFSVIINKLGILYTDDLFIKWKKFDKEYWHKWESGKMIIPDNIKTLEDKKLFLRANRIMIFFSYLKIDFNTAIEINNLYCHMLGKNIVEIENANTLLEELNSFYNIVIATNGPKEAAINKLEIIKVKKYVSLIVTSEEVGFSKPSREFFEFLFNKLPNKDKSKLLLIGDSLTTDILGGMSNGIDTCWFNPNNYELPEYYHPTMTIHKLLELKKKL